MPHCLPAPASNKPVLARGDLIKKLKFGKQKVEIKGRDESSFRPFLLVSVCVNSLLQPVEQIHRRLKWHSLRPSRQLPTVAAPSLAVMVIGLVMVMVSALDPPVMMKTVPPKVTALVPWARVLKGYR